MTPIRLISTKEFAALVSISTRKARSALENCHQGKTWRKIKLDVVLEKGKGGKNGLQYMVVASSIPDSFLNIKSTNSESSALVLPVAEPNQDQADVSINGELIQAKHDLKPIPRKKQHYQEQSVNFKLDLVKRIRTETDPNTPERAALIRELAATVRYSYGKKRGKLVGANTLRSWLKEYENDGLAAVCRKARTDSGKRRVTVSRIWDETVDQIGLSDDEQQRLAADLQRHVASLWRSGSPSAPTLQLSALPFAINQLMQAGCTLSKEQLQSVCKLPLTFIRQQAHFKLVDIYRKDAGRYAAKHNPRIKRSRANLKPMDWVAGDVHHIDIAFQRENGSICTIKAVAWLDLATNRTFISPFLMPKGEMIRREHVIESFVAMCADPNWGVPTRLYLDRGGEYNWGEFVEDLCRLKQKIIITDELDDLDETNIATGVNRSLPYNPQSKVIETLFSSLEKSSFSQIEGHMGGDRLKKKVENQGKAPVPYYGDFSAFEGSLKTALGYYHVKSQQGHLNGQSPNQYFNTFVLSGEWKSVLLDPDELAVAFCKKEFRNVNAGGRFWWKNTEYRHDSLIPMADLRKVQVGEPLYGDKKRLFLFDEEDNPIGIAEPVIIYDFGDVAGAGEQQRQAALARQEIRDMEAATDKLNLEDVMRDVVSVIGTSEQAEIHNVVSIGNNHRQIAKTARENPSVTESQNENREHRRQQSAVFEELAQKARAAGGG